MQIEDTFGNLFPYIQEPAVGDLIICTGEYEVAVFTIEDIHFVFSFSAKTGDKEIFEYCNKLRRAGFQGRWFILSVSESFTVPEDIFYLRDCPLENFYEIKSLGDFNFGKENI